MLRIVADTEYSPYWEEFSDDCIDEAKSRAYELDSYPDYSNVKLYKLETDKYIMIPFK